MQVDATAKVIKGKQGNKLKMKLFI